MKIEGCGEVAGSRGLEVEDGISGGWKNLRHSNNKAGSRLAVGEEEERELA